MITRIANDYAVEPVCTDLPSIKQGENAPMGEVLLQCTKDMVVATLASVPDKPGVLAHIYSELLESGVGVELITGASCSKDLGNVSVAFPKNEIDRSKMILERLGRTMGAKSCAFYSDVSLLAVRETGETGKAGWQGRVISGLAAKGINLFMPNLALHMLTLLVAKKQLQPALDCLKDMGIGPA